MTPSFLGAIFDYAFNICGVWKVIATISDDNTKSIRLVKNMGFIEEARIADAHDNGDFLIFTMTRPQCRFLGRRYVERYSIAASGA